MLLIDENSTVMQGSIGAVRQLKFKQHLSEGYVHSKRSNPKYRLSDVPLSIRFNDGTTFEKLTTSVRTISTEHILQLGNTGKELPDVMGELSAIRSTTTDRLPGAQRVMLTLRLESMFDSLALAFHGRLDSYGREQIIVLVTSVNPKDSGGGGNYI